MYNHTNIGGPLPNAHDFDGIPQSYPMDYSQVRPPHFLPPPQLYPAYHPQQRLQHTQSQQPYQPYPYYQTSQAPQAYPPYEAYDPYYQQQHQSVRALKPHPPPVPSYETPRRTSEASISSLEYSDIQMGNGSINPLQLRITRIPSPVLIPCKKPLRRAANGPDGAPLRSGQIPRVTRKKEQRPNPREWYGSPPPPTESWGPKDKNGRPLFKYTECGELERGKAYTIEELRTYLFGPKKNDQFTLPERPDFVPGVEDKVRQGLTLWIGWVAPQSNDRYPYPMQSSKCRFADCEDKQNTIRTGFPRIIFDERMNDDGEAIDPYHNAGYVHLYCFEQYYDLIEVMIHLDVRPDERNFKHEDNLFKLTRQFPDMRGIIDGWWHDEYPKYTRAKQLGKRRNHRIYENSLSYRIVQASLDNSSDARLKLREERGGANLSKHKGDLVKQQFLKNCKAFNLLDANDDPIPGAEDMLGALMQQKSDYKKQERKGRRESLARKENLATAEPANHQPAVEHQGNATQINHHGVQVPAGPFFIHSPNNAYSPMPRGPPSPPGVVPAIPDLRPEENTSRKRSWDQVSKGGQGVDGNHDSSQDYSNKKPRISSPIPDYTGQEHGNDGEFVSFEVSNMPYPVSSENPGLGLDFDFEISTMAAPDAVGSGHNEKGDGKEIEGVVVEETDVAVEALDSIGTEEDDLFGNPADEAGLADQLDP
ncbi:hypothetical protein F5Y11DRAFT_322781 [Daldinia sp. FL1419]|nr:hypothetical protein F5Y11DRAFT_322781 [Daldinia sp. FL1419]